MKKIKILIANTDKNYYQQLKEKLEENNDIQVIAYCNDGKKAIYEIYLKKPDIVLMDNILNTWDGMGVLEYLKDKDKLDFSIIFISSIYNHKIESMLLSRGARCVLGKEYNIQELKNKIRQYYKEDQNNYNKTLIQNELLNYIQKILIELGFKSNVKGYRYLRELLKIKYYDINIKTNKAFKEVAKKYSTTISCVERAISYSIKETFNRNREKFWYNISYNNEESPKNEEFINIIIEQLIMYYDVLNIKNMEIKNDITGYKKEYR